MSNVTDVQTVLDLLMRRSVPADRVSKIVDLCLSGEGFDPNSADNEVKAGLFLKAVKREVKSRCQSQAIGDAQRANAAAEKTAIDDVDADFS